MSDVYILGLIKQKKTFEAQKMIQNLYYKNPGRYYYYMGLCYHSQGDFLNALECMKSSEKSGFINYGLYYNFGVIYLDINDCTNAQICFEKSLKLNKSFASSYINLAYIHCTFNDYKSAYRTIKGGLANIQSDELFDLEKKIFKLIGHTA